MSRKRLLLPALLGACIIICAHPVAAQTPHPADAKACVDITIDSLRLACYDRALGRAQAHGDTAQAVQEDAPAPAASTATTAQAIPTPDVVPAPASAAVDRATNRDDRQLFGREDAALQTRSERVRTDNATGSPRPSLLNSRWELDDESKLGTFGVRGYKPVYFMPAFYMTRINDSPHSPSPDHTLGEPLGLQHTEAKFQLSLKTKVWQGVIAGHGDLWLAYTQASHWQIYNSRISRPFRETNYEPEAMLVFDTNYHVLGWKAHLMGIGVDHQSNGRSNPLSRSWNRVIADIGLERGPWTIMIRPWWRIPEQGSKDDNPDISNYMGRTEVQIVREWGANEFTLMGRHSLRTGSNSRGALRFTWAFPIHDNLRGYVQVFNGYGESLIDYNHRATYVGLGISLLGWY